MLAEYFTSQNKNILNGSCPRDGVTNAIPHSPARRSLFKNAKLTGDIVKRRGGQRDEVGGALVTPVKIGLPKHKCINAL